MKPSPMRGRPVSGPGAPRWVLVHSVKGTIGRILLALFRVRITGWENVPAGSAILAGNHVSYLDPALLWCVARRPVHFVGKAELWESSLLGWILDRLWVIPVRRATADREMIQAASALLEAGDLLGMFPEGTRKRDVDSEELGEAHGGVAFLAIRNGVPVLPVGIAGTDKALPAGAKMVRFPRVTMHIGEPIHPDAFEGGRKERMEAMTACIMQGIAGVLDEARGEGR